MKKYFIIFAAVAILGMLAIYFVPNKKVTSVTTTTSQTSNTNVVPQSTTDTTTSQSTDQTPSSTSTSTTSTSAYKDGTYTGKNVSTEYGSVKIGITVSGGKITAVNFIAMPDNERHSMLLSEEAEPILKSQTINAQSAAIDGVSGATYTSEGYVQSLQSAIDAARV